MRETGDFSGSWSFLIDYLMKREIKGVVIPMIFFDEFFQWRFEVEWQEGRDEVMPRNILGVVSNLDQAKWEKNNEAEETLFIYEKKI